MSQVLALLSLVGSIACGDDETSTRPSKGEPRPDAGGPQDAAAADSGRLSPPDARPAQPEPAEAGAPAAMDAAVDDGPGRTVTIRFEGRVGDEPFDCHRIYTVPGLGRVEPREFKFYVQDLALLDRDGKEVPVRILERPQHQNRDVALIDFETGTGSCRSNEATNMQILGKVPEGDYRGVVFTNGVPVELNHEDPATFPPPLQDFSMYWNWFQGFKFLVGDLAAASTPPEPGEEDAGMAPAQSVLHVGSAGCSPTPAGKTECVIPNRNRVRLPDFDPDSDVILADLAAVFAGAQAGTETFCHGGRATCTKVYANVGLDLATGAATDTQRVFRVK